MENGDEKPIAYASCTLKAAEKYAQIDKEGLAVMYGVKNIHQMLYARSYCIKWNFHKRRFQGIYDQ